MFLSSFFRAPGALLLSEKFKVQVRRGTRKIAVPVTSIIEGAKENRVSTFSDTDFTPAIYKEQLTVSGEDLWNQEFGNTVFEQDQYAAVQARIVELGMDAIEGKIRRGLELQAAQILSTGTLALTDDVGATRVSVNFGPKAGHFATAGTSWASSTTKIADLAGLQELVRVNGKATVKNLIFGERAWADFQADADVRAILDNRRIEHGAFTSPRLQSPDASYLGKFTLRHNEVNLWTYTASYENPQTGADTKYVNQDHIIMLPENPEFDAMFGGIPRVQPLPGGENKFRKQVVIPEKGIAFDTIQWASQDLSAYTVQTALRALLVPTAVDTYARLQTR
jgi:hypothetical protein